MVLALILQPFLAGGQESISVLPGWQVNESRSVSIERHEVKYENGVIIEDTVEHLDSEIKVLRETAEGFEISILYQNVAYRSAVEIYSAFREELKEYEDFELIYSINKTTGAHDLENWKETQSFMTTGMDQIQALVDEKVPEMSFLIQLAYAPMQAAFASEEDTKAFMDDQFGFLLYPYGKTLTEGDTLITTDSSPNPFNPMETVTLTTKTFVTDLNLTTCKIHKQVMHDLRGYKTIMKAMMTAMAEKTGQALTKEKMQEIESMDFSMTDETTIEFDLESAWPIKSTSTATVISKDPRRDSRGIVTTTAILK